ncbi:FtsK/SpoIIIE domain-containing protein [Glycomyces algeriensis]|uniref:Cell division protein FtsK n=1 Tax=Glycomyces algeriensis TaxID=256037 RepID=A0A9W6GCX3_9ACTN|nr:FtsK/SpoIIIE domain-containing protein [Glycomyces algeriensis]MDA1367857.1 FtsK/SpoIIIE domain-containing protein [Glycomyces algeriensis]MDR7352003.1 S-DNA-T family DNA segregation ATPase FtsK/SpoIIIE [Glycomyces algeriensis]GLI44736.1 cell division protein FtsK [Glycomyces algeriensis]
MSENHSKSKRKTGLEWKAAAWVGRHPLITTTVPALGYAAATAPEVTAWAAGSTLAAAVAWGRAHPDSFDQLVLPHLRNLRRRWLSATYTGPAWRRNMREANLVREHPSTGELLVPRILRLRSYSSAVETVWIKILKGQTVKHWMDAAEVLAACFNAERVTVEKLAPRKIALIVQRREPFTYTIPAPEIPATVEEVDLARVHFGFDEFGREWTEDMSDKHMLVSGATGSGKNSVLWAPLFTLAPMIAEGSVRLWLCDPKQVELNAAAPIAHRYASGEEASAEVVSEFLEDQQATQAKLHEQGLRKFTPSVETPLNILIVDELGAVLAYGSDRTRMMRNRQGMALVGSQGRATGHLMWGAVQEPTKDTVPVRDLFTLRICLRVTAAVHPEMVLGDGARMRGALADEIPNIPATAGIGFKVAERTRTPLRVRAAYATDADLEGLVKHVLAERDGHEEQGGSHLRLVA